MFQQRELNLAKSAYRKKGSLSTAEISLKKKKKKVLFPFTFLRFLKNNVIFKSFIFGHLKNTIY